MFAWWGRTVVRARWWVLGAGLLLALLGAVWGTGVFGAMVGGGFNDPGSESAKATERIATEVGQRPVDILVVYSSDRETVDDAGFRAAVTGTLDKVEQRPEVSSVVSYYDTAGPAFVSTDRHATYAVIVLTQTQSAEQFTALRPDLDAPALHTQVG